MQFMSVFSSQGQQNFDACQLKSIEYVERVFSDVNHQTSNDKLALTDGNDKDYGSAGVRPKLECPKTIDMGGIPIYTDLQVTRKGFESKVEGLRNLRKVAGATACSSCQYAGKSPIEVADMRAKLAIAEARALVEQANLKHLQDRIANGEDIVADLPLNGGIYRPAIEQ
jgi:hypothetical protein